MYTINNEGLGAGPYLDMSIIKDPSRAFTHEDLDNNLTACCLTGNNEVGKNIGRLLGKVSWVSAKLVKGTDIPQNCAVQARGCARFTYDDVEGSKPVVGQSVIALSSGKVSGTKLSSVTNLVIAVYEDSKTCDVWLG